MELKPLSELIDPGTVVVKTMISTGPRQKVLSGYIAFVIGGVLVQRRYYDMPYNQLYQSALYITYKAANYAINTACKTLSGAFNVESLKA